MTFDIRFDQTLALEPSTLLEFFELDVSPIYNVGNSPIQTSFFFHGYPIDPAQSNSTDPIYQNQGALVWQGNIYYPYPIQAEGFELNGEGALPRPKIRASNIYPLLKDLARIMNGMTGAKLIRRRVFYKYLDHLPNANSSSGFGDETYLINRKTNENRNFIEFELITPIELNDLKIPRRQVINATCVWQYRCEGCGYAGQTIVDINNVPYGTVGQGLTLRGNWAAGTNYNINDAVTIIVNNVPYYYMCNTAHTSSYLNKFSPAYWIADMCSQTIAGCRLRFPNQPLPFGGFPSTLIT